MQVHSPGAIRLPPAAQRGSWGGEAGGAVAGVCSTPGCRLAAPVPHGGAAAGAFGANVTAGASLLSQVRVVEARDLRSADWFSKAGINRPGVHARCTHTELTTVGTGGVAELRAYPCLPPTSLPCSQTRMPSCTSARSASTRRGWSTMTTIQGAGPLWTEVYGWNQPSCDDCRARFDSGRR